MRGRLGVARLHYNYKQAVVGQCRRQSMREAECSGRQVVADSADSKQGVTVMIPVRLCHLRSPTNLIGPARSRALLLLPSIKLISKIFY